MPIVRLIEDGVFDPERIAVIASAYEGCLKAIGPTDRTDPAAEIVAKKIIEIARQGETNPHRMCARDAGAWDRPTLALLSLTGASPF